MNNPGKNSGASERAAFILVTDIHRSTRLWDTYRAEFKEILEKHNDEIESTVSEFGGEIMKNLGDGYIAIFQTADGCVGCGVEVQKRFARLPALPDGSALKVRVVAHGGAPMPLATGKGYFGQPLNRASRICQVCHPGQMLVSEAARSFLSALPVSATLLDLGMHRLRDLSEPEHLYQVVHPEFVEAEFDPLPTISDIRPNNLAIQPSEFVGREKELAELKSLIETEGHRLVTIAGAGGYGKSRLAMQLCAEMLDKFDGGVFAVHLAPVSDPARVPSAAADALRIQFHGFTEPSDQFVNFVKDKRILLYLDNFEHVIPARGFVSDLLKYAPGVTILVTSREPLRITGEQVFSIDPLPVACAPGDDKKCLSDAAELFIDRATLVKRDLELTDENIKLINRICESLGGAPLAIELAAAWADSFTLAEFVSELDSRLELTARLADIEPRHRSIRASLDWSYELLSAEQRELLRVLSVFSGGFYAGAAFELAKCAAVRQKLAELCDKSWLHSREVAGKTRFFVRDAAAREYAHAMLRECGDFDGAVADHIRYFASLAAAEGEKLHATNQKSATETFGIELENIFGAMENALAKISGTAAPEMPDALIVFANHAMEYLNISSRWNDGAKWSARLFDAGEKLGDSNLSSRAISRLGLFYLLLGNRFAARELLPRAVELAGAAMPEASRAEVRRFLGFEAFLDGRLEDSIEYFETSLKISETAGHTLGIASSFIYLGNIALTMGKLDNAEARYAQAIEILERCGDGRGIAGCKFNLGNIAMQKENYGEAIRLFDESLEIFEDLGERRLVAGAKLNLGHISIMRGDLDGAERLIEEGLAVRKEINDTVGFAICLLNLGHVAAMRGEAKTAAGRLSEAATVFRNAGYQNLLIEALVATAHLLQKTGNAETAAILAKGAAEVSRRAGFAMQGLIKKTYDEIAASPASAEAGAPAAETEKSGGANLGALSEIALSALASLASPAELAG